MAPEQNLINYARSVYASVQDTTGSAQSPAARAVGDAAKEFWTELKDFGEVVERIDREMDNGTIEYRVLDPDVTAVSILI